ncbi:hypothetical protein [Peptoniphilus catoniae]|uniref:hypothetical protein n=1 Tax=Peptoniphilus catoniae TaxID=1660341 RepID=UPI0010FF2FA2|nr:hypothetical protein [Peptoniphilus catoniae]
MVKTLLINQLNTLDSGDNRNIFFLIGSMDKVADILLDNFNTVKSKYYGKSTLIYNGMSLNISTDEIPEVVKKLVELGLDIYGIYELYEPK